MGCASSAPIVPPGGVVSPQAPPYELKTAPDATVTAEDSVADKIKNTVGNMTQDTMSQFMGGATQLKEDAMNKIHDFGESMKDKMESVVDEVEDKLESTFGSIGSKTDKKMDDEMEEAKQALDEMTDTVDEAKETIEEKKAEVMDEMEKELDTMVEDLEETLPRAPTATPPRVESPVRDESPKTDFQMDKEDSALQRASLTPSKQTACPKAETIEHELSQEHTSKNLNEQMVLPNQIQSSEDNTITSEEITKYSMSGSDSTVCTVQHQREQSPKQLSTAKTENKEVMNISSTDAQSGIKPVTPTHGIYQSNSSTSNVETKDQTVQNKDISMHEQQQTEIEKQSEETEVETISGENNVRIEENELNMLQNNKNKSRPQSSEVNVPITNILNNSKPTRPESQKSNKSSILNKTSLEVTRQASNSSTLQTNQTESVELNQSKTQNISRPGSKSQHSSPHTPNVLSQPNDNFANNNEPTEKMVDSPIQRPQSNKSKHSLPCNKEFTNISPNLSNISRENSTSKLSTHQLNGLAFSPVNNINETDKNISSSPLITDSMLKENPLITNNNAHSADIHHIITPSEGKKDAANILTSNTPTHENSDGKTSAQELIGVT